MTIAIIVYGIGVIACLLIQLILLNGEDMRNCSICRGRCEAAGWPLTALVALTWPILLVVSMTPAWRDR